MTARTRVLDFVLRLHIKHAPTTFARLAAHDIVRHVAVDEIEASIERLVEAGKIRVLRHENDRDRDLLSYSRTTDEQVREAGIRRSYSASRSVMDNSLPTVAVQAIAPEPNRYNDHAGSVSIGNGDVQVWRGDRAASGRRLAAEIIRGWRRDGLSIARTRHAGHHGCWTFIPCPAPGFKATTD